MENHWDNGINCAVGIKIDLVGLLLKLCSTFFLTNSRLINTFLPIPLTSRRTISKIIWPMTRVCRTFLSHCWNLHCHSIHWQLEKRGRFLRCLCKNWAIESHRSMSRLDLNVLPARNSWQPDMYSIVEIYMEWGKISCYIKHNSLKFVTLEQNK